jgi:hypothetical protein
MSLPQYHRRKLPADYRPTAFDYERNSRGCTDRPPPSTGTRAQENITVYIRKALRLREVRVGVMSGSGIAHHPPPLSPQQRTFATQRSRQLCANRDMTPSGLGNLNSCSPSQCALGSPIKSGSHRSPFGTIELDGEGSHRAWYSQNRQSWYCSMTRRNASIR